MSTSSLLVVPDIGGVGAMRRPIPATSENNRRYQDKDD
jgi:hypothetical protein